MLQERRVRPDCRALRGIQDRKELMGYLVLPARMEHRVLTAPLEQRVQREPREPRVVQVVFQ